MRVSKWQKEVTDAVSWHQDQALSALIFILRETGPTSFLLKEEGEERKCKVSLGDPHTCSCSVYKKEKNPCKHICWLLLKKFKLQRYDELAYQFGLVEREINQILQGPRATRRVISQPPKYQQKTDSDGRKILEQREVTEVDVCPICQEELLDKHLPVTYCRYGCGNNIHIKCMKIWAEHQRQTSEDSSIKCPMCREVFGSYYSLLEEFRNCMAGDSTEEGRLDIHFSTTCNTCQMSPIKGKCYKCTTCSSYYLCNTCYHANKHMQHSFDFRVKRSQRWRPAKSRTQMDSRLESVFQGLSTREITEDDYDLLLQLDRPSTEGAVPVDLAGFPDHVINRIPVFKVRPMGKLLAPGRQCRICLRSYEVGQYVRKLPSCKHIFHRDCIDKWLSEDHRRCPVDRKLVFDGPQKKLLESVPSRGEVPSCSGMVDPAVLMVPGIGIAKLRNSPHAKNRHGRQSNESIPAIDRLIPSSSHITFGDLIGECHALRPERKTPDAFSFSLPGTSVQTHVRSRTALPHNQATNNGIVKGTALRKATRHKEVTPEDQKLDLWLTGSRLRMKNDSSEIAFNSR